VRHISHAIKKAKSLTPWCAKGQMCPYKTNCCVDQLCSTCDMCQTWITRLQKVGRFSTGWFVL